MQDIMQFWNPRVLTVLLYCLLIDLSYTRAPGLNDWPTRGFVHSCGTESLLFYTSQILRLALSRMDFLTTLCWWIWLIATSVLGIVLNSFAFWKVTCASFCWFHSPNLHPRLSKQRAVKVKRVMTCKWGTLMKRRKRHHLKDCLLFDQDISMTVQWILFEKMLHFCFIILLQRIEKAMGTHFRSKAKTVAEPTSQRNLNLGWGLLSNVLNVH